MIPITKEGFESNLATQSFFSIDESQTALILSILRNNIYSNPLLAAFKETLSNAIDEHIKYDIKTPVEINIPNSFSNSFSVRDYAKGLSIDFMTNYYTKVGYSTKSESNDLLGGFGLGRMSPLAYTDLYMITSITEEQEGKVKCEYVISKDNNKVFCSLLSKEQTEEHTGVKVSFVIKEHDFSLMNGYVYNNVKYIFNIPIIINGVLNNPQTIIYDGQIFKVIPRDSYYGPTIGLIGGLPNKIFLKDYRDYTPSLKFEYLSRIMNNTTICFDIKIGSVDQSADKDIQLSEKTKRSIGKCFSKIVDEFKVYVSNKIEKLEHWDEVEGFLVSYGLLIYPIKWRNADIKANNWLADVITFKTTKKGNTLACKEKYTYFSSRNTYYYNDLDHIPNTKLLVKHINNLERVCIVNNIDNKIYNLRLLSDAIPKDYKPAPLKQTRVVKSVNPKCHRLSNTAGILGRELNIDLGVKNYYISSDIYNNSIFDGPYRPLRNLLFKYINKDIYVVKDVSLVKDVWIDLIEEIREKFKNLDTNFFLYKNNYVYKTVLCLRNSEEYIRENPNSCITKFLIQDKLFRPYLSYYDLLQTLHNANIIRLKESSYSIKDLVEEIETKYPLLESSIKQDYSYIDQYISQVDYFNKKDK